MSREPISLSTIAKSGTISLLLTFAGVVVTLLNIWLVSKLAPLSENIAVISLQIRANEQKDNIDHPTFVTHEQLQREITTRLDRIENKLDALRNK